MLCMYSLDTNVHTAHACPHLEVEVAVHNKLAGVGARHGRTLTSSEQPQRPDVDSGLAVGL